MILKLLKVDLLSLCCISLLSACSFGLRSTSSSTVLNQPSSQLLLSAIEENRVQVSSLRGRARIKVVSTRENLRIHCLILAQKPDRWRLEILNPMNMPVSLFLNNGEEWINYSLAENRYLKGNSKGDATMFGLKVKDVISFLSGELPLLPYNRENVECFSDGDLFLVTIPSEDGVEKIWINPEGNRIVKGEFYDLSGKMKLKVGFEEFQKAGDVLFPYQIEIYLPKDFTWITLTYEDIQVNPVLENSLFYFIPPPEAELDLTPHSELQTPNP